MQQVGRLAVAAAAAAFQNFIVRVRALSLTLLRSLTLINTVN